MKSKNYFETDEDRRKGARKLKNSFELAPGKRKQRPQDKRKKRRAVKR